MRSLPLPARFVCWRHDRSSALYSWCRWGRVRPSTNPALFAVLLVTSAVTSAFKVSLPLAKSGSTMSVSYAVDFAALLLLGPNETMLVAVTSAWSQCTFRMKTKNPVYRTLFSMACLAITVQASGFAYEALGGVPGTLAHDVPGVARPLVAAATMYFIFNTCLIAVAVSLATRQSFVAVWNQNFLWSAPSYFVGAGAAAIATLGGDDARACGSRVLAAAPLYLTYRTYKVYLGRIDDERRHVEEMADLHLATIEALALAIDAKDQTAQSHIRRVQVYATSIARGLGMSDTEIQGVKTAALLHDIGKLAVPEHILSKPGPLTQEEFQKIRVHPQVGAEIISAVPFPYPVAPLILSHHERWDGKGYPQGLKGEEIPLGARILSVVDYYDALTSDRPYHKAMTPEAALALLQQEAGRALDPAVVQMFVKMAAEMEAAAGTIETATPRRLSLEPTNERGRPAVGFQPEIDQEQHGVRRHRARASRNLRALRNRADDGHQPRRRRHHGADLVEAVEPRAVLGLRAVPVRRGSRHAALPLRDRRRSRRDRHDDRARRPGPRRLGGAQSPAARQRAPERGVRSRRASPSRPRCSRRWSRRWCSAIASSARSRSTRRSRTSTPTITAACSIASASRPPPSSTTRSCSSRRRKIR